MFLTGVGSVDYQSVVPGALIMKSIPEDREAQKEEDPYAEVQVSLMETRVDVYDEHV